MRSRARYRAGSRVVVVAGPGNNGGDGFVAARLLAERGYRRRGLAWSASVGAAQRRRRARRQGMDRADRRGRAPARSQARDVVIDALFGAGLDRPVEGLPRAMIEAMNAQAAPVIAVDLPSGINGTSGAVMGAAVNAAQTVTFFRKKPGHVLLPGRLYCGAISVADIGIPDIRAGAISRRRLSKTSRRFGARIFRVPQRRRAQIRPRTCGRRLRSVLVDRGGAACGARRVAGRRRAWSPSPARARRSRSMLRQSRGDGAAGRRRCRADRVSRRSPAQCVRDRARRGCRARRPARSSWRRFRGERAVVLDADAITSFADRPAAACRGASNGARRQRHDLDAA